MAEVISTVQSCTELGALKLILNLVGCGMENAKWHVAIIYKCGEDMVCMFMKLSGYVLILNMHV